MVRPPLGSDTVGRPAQWGNGDMALVAWDDSLSIGVKMFDDEHKDLIAVVNELYAAYAREAGQYELEGLCDRLIEHVVMHFRHEEMYFGDWQYPDSDEHTASHRRLRRQLVDYRDQILKRPEPQIADQLFAQLKDWLCQHMLNEDRSYGAFLVARGLR
jgi:hemerythrin